MERSASREKQRFLKLLLAAGGRAAFTHSGEIPVNNQKSDDNLLCVFLPFEVQPVGKRRQIVEFIH